MPFDVNWALITVHAPNNSSPRFGATSTWPHRAGYCTVAMKVTHRPPSVPLKLKHRCATSPAPPSLFVSCGCHMEYHLVRRGLYMYCSSGLEAS